MRLTHKFITIGIKMFIENVFKKKIYLNIYLSKRQMIKNNNRSNHKTKHKILR